MIVLWYLFVRKRHLSAAMLIFTLLLFIELPHVSKRDKLRSYASTSLTLCQCTRKPTTKQTSRTYFV